MGRAPCCDKNNVKKGPWSPEEDAKLKEFIEKHGTGGNWIALPQKAGLRRCGKSCRLRWLNYLRPNIKHGEFTEHEDRVICSMYASIGSRWSIIASQLPGRTDNDIKNYWNTKLKKKLLGSSALTAPPHHRAPRQHHHHRPLNLMLQQHSSSSSLSQSIYGGGGFFSDAGGSLHDPSIPALLTLPPPPHHQDFMLGTSGLNASSLLQQQPLHHMVKEESGGSMIMFGSSDQQSCSPSADNGGGRLSQFGHGKELSFDGGYYGSYSNGSMEHHDHSRLLHQLHQSAHHQVPAVEYNYDEIKQLLNMSSSTVATTSNLHGGGGEVHTDVASGGMEGLGSAQGKVTMM